MSMREAVAGCLVLACLVALLAEKTEGHITFFSPKEMMLLKEREGRKDMEPQSNGQFEEETVQQLPRVERGESPDETLEIGVRLSPKQLDHVLKEIIHEIVEEHQKAK